MKATAVLSDSLSRGAGEGRGEGISRARALRRRQTDTERKLWDLVRSRQLAGWKFRRQHPIGQYITDFCCLAQRLVVELDGGQHLSTVDTDRRRTAWLESRGYRVIRFWDHDVLQHPETVADTILHALESPHPHPLPVNGERVQKEKR